MELERRNDTRISTTETSTNAVFSQGYNGFKDIADNLLYFSEELKNLSVFADKKTSEKLDKLVYQAKRLQPSVTIIGQIKAGKTSLVNAMIGLPDFLPADVNPWTSVVTSLHLNSLQTDESSKACFRFFNEDEWDRLVSNGGRIGELAARVGAEDEVSKLREQIKEMREKAENRLGRKFEMLLGQEHNYGYIDDALIQRYVCMGDDDDDGPDGQGRFVDITKSADLFLDRPEIPIALTLRDTPGVNDTFMMREQITINAIRESRICVVVLSAHQALTTMDMALIRLISNLKSREVLIFVNRIDELSDPANQVPEIRKSIIDTLKKNNAPASIDIVFGSAQWANSALLDQTDYMHEDSTAAVVNWTKSEFPEEFETLDGPELVWKASGIPALFDVLATRISEGPYSDLVQNISRKAINIGRGLEATDQAVLSTQGSTAVRALSSENLSSELDQIEANVIDQMKDSISTASESFMARVDQVHDRFLERATSSLIEHLEINGEDKTWEYSPMGLRVLLRSSYQTALRKVKSISGDVNTEAAEKITELYIKLFDVTIEGFKIEGASAPHIPPPVNIGKTIALDIQTNWWKGWRQRRKGYQTFAKDFYELIRAETDPLINDLKQTQVSNFEQETMNILTAFLEDQRDILTDVSRRAVLDRDELNVLFGISQWNDRSESLNLTIEELSAYAA